VPKALDLFLIDDIHTADRKMSIKVNEDESVGTFERFLGYIPAMPMGIAVSLLLVFNLNPDAIPEYKIPPLLIFLATLCPSFLGYQPLSILCARVDMSANHPNSP
jgi:hypothetical protein